ncbi:MAG: ferritin-like domain-containing protein [Dehalococcoidia bacterium]|nr:ferritin-like domain-containing protein [Dehalococcoidia bacterium]MDZ4277581.1 ferritin-like domain-containing protein [Dehalococcoidia bacterium]
MPKGSKRLLDAMNDALSEELASIVQYLWHHIQARGIHSAAIAGRFKSVAMVEMKHAELIAERIDLLGGQPTTALDAISPGTHGDVKRMLEDNLTAEQKAVDMYRRLLQMARDEDDPVSRIMLEEILGDTEDHAHELENLLADAGDVKAPSVAEKTRSPLIDALNVAVSDELASVIQYQWHHVMAQGIASPAILEMFESHSMDEMRHAYAFAERIDLLGGDLTVELHPIAVGGDLRKMIQDDLEGEYRAIEMYKGYVKLAEEQNDPVTRRMMEETLGTEEGHADEWENVLEK